MGNGIRADLHIHSKYSDDGVLEPEEIVTIAKEKGLAGIAITDHNTIRGGVEAKKYETGDLEVVVGAEIATEKGEVTGLFLSKEIKSRRFGDVVNEIRAQGGVVVVPHPFDTLRHSAFRITGDYAGAVDAIEVFNSRCILANCNNRAVRFANQHSLAITAGSDAHYPNEIGLAGVLAYSGDIRMSILEKNVKVFGERSPLLNHVRTRTGKLWRKATRRAH